MRNRHGQFGFTLLEVLVALATVLILLGALIGVGRYIKTSADIKLTNGLLETLCTALTQYYDDTGNFPFATNVPDSNMDGYWLDEYVGLFTVTQGTIPQDAAFETSAALFYFLDRNPDSRAIAEAVSSSLVTNKDDGGQNITISIGGNPAIDLPRYIDPWGTSIRYAYLAGMAFPVLRSAGPDKVFDTPDDITSQ